jgi:hypothetical protein
MLSRRSFLCTSGGAIAASLTLRAEVTPSVPLQLDHILLGCNDLDGGMTLVEDRTGIRAARGGVHPGRDTQNALLSLGELRYLEIIAPDPAQPDAKDPLALYLKKLSAPQLVGWAAHPGDIRAFAKKLQEAGVAFEGPTPGSRQRPDGRVLQWQTLMLKDDASGLLPFFIEWSADPLHPSADSPPGCRLVGFALVTPEPDQLAKTAALLSLDVPITRGNQPQLHATITGPKGTLHLSS